MGLPKKEVFFSKKNSTLKNLKNVAHGNGDKLQGAKSGGVEVR